MSEVCRTPKGLRTAYPQESWGVTLVLIFLKNVGFNDHSLYFPEAPEESSEDVTTYQEGAAAENTTQNHLDVGKWSSSL